MNEVHAPAAERALIQSAFSAAEMLRAKEISSGELTEMQLGRIEAVNPAINAVVGSGARRRWKRRPPPTLRSPEATTSGLCTASP